MKKRVNFFLVVVLILSLILMIYFVIATSGNLAPATAGNGTIISVLWFNVSNSSNLGNNLTSVTVNQTILASSGNAGNVTNVTISNGTSVYYNASFAGFPVVISIGNISANTNFTLNFTINSSAANAAQIQANITANVSDQNVTFSPVLPYNSTVITIDSLPPLVLFASQTLANASNNQGNLTVNVTANDTVSSVFNITISVNGTAVKLCASSPCFYTNNSADGSYLISASANDTYGHTNNSLSSRTVIIDNTNPTATFSCSPNSVYQSNTVGCTCNPSDATSGINSTATTYTAAPSTASLGTFVLTCTFADNAGNTGVATTSYTVSAPTSSYSSSASSSSSYSWANIPAYQATSISVSSISGVTSIVVTTNQNVLNPSVIITPIDTTPSSSLPVSGGETFQTFQINPTNLNSINVVNVSINFKVNASWITSNSLDANKVIMFRNSTDTGNQWTALTTSLTSQDSQYYYYTAVSPGFSTYTVFAPSQSSSSSNNNSTGTTATAQKSSSVLGLSVYYIVLIIVVVLALGVAAYFLIKRRKMMAQY